MLGGVTAAKIWGAIKHMTDGKTSVGLGLLVEGIGARILLHRGLSQDG
jgi:hypothetical protein